MSSGNQTIAGVERALDVLTLFADLGASDLGVTEIADELDLSKAVVHRILSSFRVKGFVELDPSTRRYRVGPRTLTVGLSYLDRVDQLGVVRSALADLAERTGETATQSVRAGTRAVHVGQVPSTRQVRVVVELGAAYPLHVGSASKVLLAHAPADRRDEYLSHADLDRGPEGLRDELLVIRDQGFCVTWGEREPGIGAVSAPIVDHTGLVVAALTVCGPEGRFRLEHEAHVKVLVDVADQVSRRLGADAAPHHEPQLSR